LLYRKQKRMKWLEVMDLDRNVLPDLKKNAKMQTTLFSHARKLALYPENTATLDLCQYFVEKTADVLEELIVHANFDLHDSDHSPPPTSANTIDNRELNDTAAGPGVLSRTIFSHMLPFEKCTPFKSLTALRLHRISLRHSADTWCKVVDFTRVQSLRLYQCSGADSLFGQLCKSSCLPKRLKILEFQHKDNAENEALIALDGFLCLVSGIRDLIVDMEGVKSLPAAASIVRHSNTLELLNVHASDESNHTASPESDADEHVWSGEDFKKICKACTRLEQLSCAWPATSLIRAPNDEWKAYETALTTLKTLVTLHISTFPSNKPSTQLLPRSVYEQLLQGLATRLFDTAMNGDAKSDTTNATSNEGGEQADQPSPIPDFTPPTHMHSARLHLLAFGISEKIYEREDSKNQILYLRSTCKSALGQETIYAAPITWCMRQFVEPRSDVLDFVLHRESRMPCRDREGVGHAWGDDDE
jgi:hypothetical protein